jgi:predicted ABC-type transport system involved in lysophospholipase L1 biosynthesis ATPase subunit
MLNAREVTKEYMSGEQKLAVLRDVSFTIAQGAFVAIVGPSGSGKTTLLGLLAGLDTPTRGTVVLDGADLGKLNENERARLRGEKWGVAIARAFANSPRILFADEPTGNLDNATGHRIFELLQSLNSEGGSTIVLVTHDASLAAQASRIIRLLDGVVVEDTGAGSGAGN